VKFVEVCLRRGRPSDRTGQRCEPPGLRQAHLRRAATRSSWALPWEPVCGPG